MTYQKARYQQNHEFVKNIKKELPEISIKEDNVIRGVFPSAIYRALVQQFSQFTTMLTH